MRFTPAGMVINTRNTGMKRQINTAHTPYFLNQSFALLNPTFQFNPLTVSINKTI